MMLWLIPLSSFTDFGISKWSTSSDRLQNDLVNRARYPHWAFGQYRTKKPCSNLNSVCIVATAPMVIWTIVSWTSF
ncbi:hypothetical protein BD309DRAFT_287653 [Dichomitus squalens]|nr:hypothetical protein BD309DRAFT_287653 [Dichomitus squalens]